ncbi:DUF971 domain-containing protein [Roseibium sp. MMSF_3544]|uniref:DUF971 domain-containing protein n=1 Tax=unclassified Roseibium TaxID=2629323 RepID=UPI00273D9AB0|nr:DUF971 domain-containing protein [Roseibium sp. MMSF_3544]
MSADNAPWPTELRVSSDKKALTIAFDSGERYELPAEYLRVCSPSAEVKGHSPSQKQTVPGKRNVEIMKVEPVGNYAVRIHFDDMHNSGIYSWRYFRELATEPENHWEVYLQEMEQKGLSRDL